MTKYSDAQRRAINQYRTEKVESLTICVPKGKRKEIKEAASSAGLNMTQFVLQAIDHEIEAAAPGSSAAASDPDC